MNIFSLVFMKENSQQLECIFYVYSSVFFVVIQNGLLLMEYCAFEFKTNCILCSSFCTILVLLIYSLKFHRHHSPNIANQQTQRNRCNFVVWCLWTNHFFLFLYFSKFLTVYRLLSFLTSLLSNRFLYLYIVSRAALKNIPIFCKQ